MRALPMMILSLVSGAPAKGLGAEIPPGHAAEAPTEVEPKRYRVEVNLIQPFVPTVGIIRPKLAVNLWGDPSGASGDLVVGAYLRPHIEHDILFHIDEYLATLGYRQYLYRGLHLEALLNGGAAWGTNRYDGKFYRTPSVFVDLNLGYRLAFFEPGGLLEEVEWPVGIFITAQAGVLFSVGVADIGPRNGKPDVFPQAELLAGVSF